jgi:hypothetical protein
VVTWQKLVQFVQGIGFIALPFYVLVLVVNIGAGVYGIFFDHRMYVDALFAFLFLNPIMMCAIVLTIAFVVWVPTVVVLGVIAGLNEIPFTKRAFERFRKWLHRVTAD